MSALERGAERGRIDDGRHAVVLDTARAAIAQEFQIAERLDAKARNQVGVGSGLFALVQAIAAIGIKQHLDNPGNRWLFGLLVAFAVISFALLAYSIYLSFGVWKLRDEHEITAEGLAEMASDASTPDSDLFGRAIEHYEYLLTTRRENNEKRAKSFDSSTTPWALSMVLGLAELIAALAVLAMS